MNPRRANLWTVLAGQFGPLLALVLVFHLFAVADATQEGGGRSQEVRHGWRLAQGAANSRG